MAYRRHPDGVESIWLLDSSLQPAQWTAGGAAPSTHDDLTALVAQRERALVREALAEALESGQATIPATRHIDGAPIELECFAREGRNGVKEGLICLVYSSTRVRDGCADRLGEEIARTQRYAGRLAVIRLELDGWDRLYEQDTAGAYEALTRLEALLERNTRRSDHYCRWSAGGHLIVAPGMNRSDATGFAVKMRQAVARFFRDPALTASFGVASYRTGEDCGALVHRAEAALAAAQTRGEDRIETG